jgi:hypothetical protein
VKLELSYDWAFPARTFWATYYDTGYTTRLHLGALGSTSVEVVSLEGDLETGFRRTLRYGSRPDAPGPVKKLFGDEIVTVEESVYDPATSTSTFSLVPGTLADKTDIRGSIRVTDRDGGCEELFQLEARVRIFGAGPIVERFIEREARQFQDTCVTYMRKELGGG